MIYGNGEELRNLLPATAHWRIVKHDLTSPDAIVDWTHEREWRYPGNLKFQYDQIEVIVAGHDFYKRFVTRCLDEKREDILRGINGIIPLYSVVG